MPDNEKLQNLIDEIVEQGSSVAFQKWNEELQISITTIIKGHSFKVAEKFDKADLLKVPMYVLLERVRRKLNEQG